MNVKQISEIVNKVTKEVLGEAAITSENLSGIVDVGTAVFNQNAVDNYVKTLVDHIGRVIFVNRTYAGRLPRLYMDDWEYGSVMEKISITAPDAQDNETWNLTDGEDYSQDVFTAPTVSAKFYDSKTTYEVALSITELQVKEAFSSPAQMVSFANAIETAVQNSLKVKNAAMAQRTINNLMGEVIASEYPSAGYGDKSGVRAINLLYLYNQETGQSLTAAKAITTPEFIRFAAYRIGLTSDRLSEMSTLFNVGKNARFTPKEMQRIVLLSDFARAADAYLQADTFHDEFTKLPEADIVSFWQGSGTDYGFTNTSQIHVNTASGEEVVLSGILGVIFDRDAAGITNYNPRVTSHYNARAEFTNIWYKQDCSYFNDTGENCVVFFIADPTQPGN